MNEATVNSSDPAATTAPSSFWRRRVRDPIVAQLKQGTTPEKISLTIALGVTLGVFPILGSTTALCLAAAALFKLNQPVIHLVNWFAYPLQIPLILVFIRLGEKIVGAPPVPFSITDMLQRFKDSPAQFLRDFGLTGLHGICGWLVVAPLVVAILYFTLRPVLRKMAKVRIG